MSTECLHRVTGAQDGVQERCRRAAVRGLRVSRAAIGVAAALALPGCSMPDSMNAVDWWHSMEGGRIAEARPPPPNADDPYPNLASVPAKPKTEDQSQRGRVATRLLADRASGEYAAATVPLTAPPPAPAAPAASTDQSNGLGARLQGASAPPPVPAAPAAAAPATDAAAADDAPMPAVPASAPPPPVIAGLGVPEITRPAPPPAPPPVTPPAPAVAAPGTALTVPFAAGSAALSTAARTALRQFATRRGQAVIAVTGYGEAGSSDPPEQSAALPLAWARAQTIAGTLHAAGVPATMLRLTAEATGDGGVAVVTD
jgi:outer membrane protein OmpA-like peptidoglycan-associated protein